MSETTELIQNVVDKITKGAEVLAEKLGVAVSELGKVAIKVWAFSVTAKVAQAKAKIAKAAAMLLLLPILFGWSLHVALSPVPHDIRTFREVVPKPGEAHPCEQIGVLNGKQVVLHETCWQNTMQEVERKEDRGVSDRGTVLIASGMLAAIFGLFLASTAISGIIDGFADTKTAEYDAYQSLIYDWKD